MYMFTPLTKTIAITLFLPLIPMLLALTGCTGKVAESADKAAFQKKVQIERLSMVDSKGLMGPLGGQVALSYEFCIPGNEQHAKEVMAIDPSVEVYRHSPGRIGCNNDQYLCIGHTHQAHFRQILEQLAAKPYVHRIQESWFE